MLPQSKTPPRSDLRDFTIELYGKPKIGKSTWCSQIDDALFLDFEGGLHSLEAYQVAISSWEQLLSVCSALDSGKHRFRAVIADTVDGMFRLCSEYTCKRLGVVHESDAPYGKGFGLANNEFARVLRRMATWPCGLVLVSHAQEIEVETRTGKLIRIEPSLPNKARRIVSALVDIIAYADVEVIPGADGQPVARRVLRTKPGANYEAGDRTGRLPAVMDLSYPAFVAAFNQSAADQASATA
jgi:AAA domain